MSFNDYVIRKSEAQKFMEEIRRLEKQNPQKLIGDLTTGYRYVDTDAAERIVEAKRRRDEVDAMSYLLTTDIIKKELNKVYGTAAYEQERINMLYAEMPRLEKFCNENDIYWSIDINVDYSNSILTEKRCYLYRFIHRPTNLKLNCQFIDSDSGLRYISTCENVIIKMLINKFHLEEKENKTMNYSQMYVKGSLFGKRQPEIKNVIFSGPCTIVQWSDGDKTIVKCENEDFDKEKGLAMAICKKFLGTNKTKSNYNDIFKKWIPEEKKEDFTVTDYTVKDLAAFLHVSESTILKDIKKDAFPGARKVHGKWIIPFAG